VVDGEEGVSGGCSFVGVVSRRADIERLADELFFNVRSLDRVGSG